MEFIAAAPVCPQCKLDGGQPKYRRFIQQLVIIHYDPPDDVAPGVGQNVTLCGGEPVWQLIRKKPYEQASGEPEAVNCPACREHDNFPKPVVQAATEPVWVGSRKRK